MPIHISSMYWNWFPFSFMFHIFFSISFLHRLIGKSHREIHYQFQRQNYSWPECQVHCIAIFHVYILLLVAHSRTRARTYTWNNRTLNGSYSFFLIFLILASWNAMTVWSLYTNRWIHYVRCIRTANNMKLCAIKSFDSHSHIHTILRFAILSRVYWKEIKNEK